MESSFIKTAIPVPVRNHLVSGKWSLFRLPSVLQYQSALLQKAPLEKQVEVLPAPKHPPVYWTELKNIKLHGSLEYPPPGRLCMSGDWDINSVYPLPSIFEDVPVDAKKWDLHETVRAIFIYGRHYSTTPQYEAMVAAVKKKTGVPPQGCRTVEEVDLYFDRLIAAFNSMQTHGYLTQKEQGKPSVSEIRLHVTRDGKLCLGTGGNHRVRMAELLGIRWVPFLLRGIHPDWVVQLCRKFALPPHKAVAQWLSTEFHIEKPIQ